MGDREQLKALVLEVLAEILAPVLGSVQEPNEDRWVPLKDAWKPLGYSSYDALWRDTTSGIFRRGKELCDRRKPGSKKAVYQINLAKARKRLLEEPSKRRAV